MQVVGRNVSILTRTMYADKASGQQHAVETVYQPCSKDRKDIFLTKVILVLADALNLVVVSTFLYSGWSALQAEGRGLQLP